jgi:hypothetical protein
MKKLQIVFGILLVAVLALAACSSSQTANDVMSDEDNLMNNSSDNMMEDKDDNMGEMENKDDMEDSSHDNMNSSMEDKDNEDKDNSSEAMPDDSAGEGDVMVKTPAWFDHEFVDARTGQAFTINSFRGQVVLVETMAMWCSNCLKQQGQVKELHNLLGERDDFVGIGIDVDLNEELGRLGTYVADNGFDWLYGVSDQEVLTGISETLGGQFLSPPSTPIVIIDREGNLHPMPFGIKSASDLLAFVEPFLNQ